MNRINSAQHFEPHDWRETAVAQLGFDQSQQVVGLVLVALRVGVARHPKKLVRVDQHRGKQQIEIVRDDVLEPDKITLIADPQKARDSETDWHFHPRHQRVRVVLVTRRDQQVERQIRDERERMRRIHRLRRHQRENVLVVILANRLALVGREAGVRTHANAVVLELAENSRTKLALSLLELAHHQVTLRDLLLRRAPVNGQLVHPRDDLLLQAADALHEELVEVGRGNREKLEPLEQRISFVFRFMQNASIEREPGELAIEEQVGRGKLLVDSRRGGAFSAAETGPSTIASHWRRIDRYSILRRRRIRNGRRGNYRGSIRLVPHMLIRSHPAPSILAARAVYCLSRSPARNM